MMMLLQNMRQTLQKTDDDHDHNRRDVFIPLSAQFNPSFTEALWPNAELVYRFHESIDPEIKTAYNQLIVFTTVCW